MVENKIFSYTFNVFPCMGNSALGCGTIYLENMTVVFLDVNKCIILVVINKVICRRLNDDPTDPNKNVVEYNNIYTVNNYLVRQVI